MKSLTWLVTILIGSIVISCSEDSATNQTNPADTPYIIEIDPANFVLASSVTGNTYFPITFGQILNYEGENEEGLIVAVEEVYTNAGKVIMGVQCITVEVSEFEGGELVELTLDWYAQDVDGNMWYFGEDVTDFENGQVVGHGGAWEAGVDGALPGIIMPVNPFVGMWYRQEYYEGEAEDVGQVILMGETLTVPFGTFSNCMRTLEYSPLTPKIEENKIYAPGVGLLRAVATKGESGFEDLVSVN